MTYNNFENLTIPDGFVVFISGVPGVGKTTISYELLRSFSAFRIIEETDLIRETIRGYIEYMKSEADNELLALLKKAEVYDHTKFLSFEEAKKQCMVMKKSIENIVLRQQRKGIPSIINGVHIIPEVLDGIASDTNLLFINLYIHNMDCLYNRFKKRDPSKYISSIVPHVYKTNMELYTSTQRLSDKSDRVFKNIDVSAASKNETMQQVVQSLKKAIQVDPT